ncbi:MAG: hypothetical protein ABSG55_03540 [Dehalococcoidia bacterium]
MRDAKATSLLPFLVIAVAALLVAGCGRSGADNAASNAPTITPFATETPSPLLPELSSITLAPAGPPAADGELPAGIYIADASTGQAYQVVTAPGPILEPWEWISPTRLVLCGWQASDRSCYLLDLDGKTLRRLPRSDEQAITFSHSGDLMTTLDLFDLVISSVADDREIGRIVNGPMAIENWNPYVSWAPDDKHIFVRSAGSTTGFIASVEAMPKTVSADTPGNNVTADWMPDSSAVVFANDSGIFSIDAASGQTTTLYSWPAGSSFAPDDVRLSPDGKSALVMEYPSRTAYVVPLDGSAGGTEITNVEPLDTQWSPTDDVLALIADRCTSDSRLLLINPDGSIRTTVDGADFIPRFSADGGMIAFVGPDPSGSGTQGSYGVVVRSAGGDYGVASFVPNFFDDTTWSPDGRWFADETGIMPPPYANSCVETASKTEITLFP